MADNRLPDELVGANRIFGAPMQKVFSPLSFFETAYLDLDMPGEEFNALFSFEEAVDKFHVADADAARPATSASAGLTSATARGHRGVGASLSAGRSPYLPQVPTLAARCRC